MQKLFNALRLLFNLFESSDPNQGELLDLSGWGWILDGEVQIVDWAKAKAEGIDGVILKAFDGRVLQKGFLENYQAALDAGLKVFAYCWLYQWYSSGQVNSANGQAKVWADFFKLHPCSGYWIDFEWTSTGNPESSHLYGALTTFEAEMQETPGIYTSPGYWKEMGSNNPIFAEYPLWIAHYGVSTPTIPAPWSEYEFWQWTELGDAAKYGIDPRIKKAVDLDKYKGTKAEFYQKYGGDPNPPEGADMWTGTSLVDGLAIFEGPDCVPLVKGVLNKDDTFIGELQLVGNDLWIFNEQGFVYVRDNSDQDPKYMSLVEGSVPGEDKTISPAGTIPVVLPDGTELHNRDEVVWE